MAVRRLLSTPLALVAALGTAGCGSLDGTRVFTEAGGAPPGAPARPAVQAPYPDVYDVPPPRAAKLMSASEQARIQAELKASRNKVDAQADALEKERVGTKR